MEMREMERLHENVDEHERGSLKNAAIEHTRGLNTHRPEERHLSMDREDRTAAKR